MGLERGRQAMGIERMVLAGHSVGSYIAFSYAERFPERVERIVMLSPAGVARPPPPEKLEARYANAPAPFRLVMTLWQKGYSPLSLVHAGAGWGPGRWLISRYIHRKNWDSSWSSGGVEGLYAEYMYRNHVAAEPSYGAHFHNTFLMPGAYARAPLSDRFAKLQWA